MRFYTSPPVSDIEFVQEYWNLWYEKNKYRMMWALRHLEQEIEEENGMFVLWDIEGEIRFESKDFSEELTEKIQIALKAAGL